MISEACPEIGGNAPLVCLFTENPYRLVSLWDIVQPFFAANFCGLFASFGILEQVASTSPPRSVVPEYWVNFTTTSVLIPASFICGHLDLQESNKFIKRLTKDFKRAVKVDALQHGLEHLRELMESEMGDHKYFQMHKSVASLYDAVYPMGESVCNAFPSAHLDLSEAGKCLACGRHNAAMHHLLLATEVGLRELGRDRQIPHALSGDIEFKQWGEIIRQIEDAVKAIQNWPNSHTKDAAHRFYNAALCELRSFNDGYRRHLAHAREHQFTEKDAIALWDHVLRFFETLATKIAESGYTPLVWT
jgi:hypothetical protein